MNKKRNLNNELDFLFCLITFSSKSELDIEKMTYLSFDAYISTSKNIVFLFYYM